MFQLSFKNIQSIFLELSAGQVRQNCRATLVIPPGTSVATIVIICCNHRDGEYFLHRISGKLGSTAASTVITSLLPLTNYTSGTENETQRALLGHTNGNIKMRSPSAAVMLTMVAAATMETFSALQAICVGNSPVTGEFPAQRPVTRSFGVFFDLNGWVNNGEAGDLRRHRDHYDVTVMRFVCELLAPVPVK